MNWKNSTNVNLLRKLKVFWVISLLFLNVACSHLFEGGDNAVSARKGRWETKMQIDNLRTDESHVVPVIFTAYGNNRLRMDVLSLIGSLEASFSIRRNSFQAIVVRDNIFYEGSNADESINKFLKIPLKSNVLYSMLYRTPIFGRGWLCQWEKLKRNKKSLKKCSHNDGTEIVWEGYFLAKRVRVIAGDYEVTTYFKKVNKNEPKDKSIFTIKKPPGFELKKIN